ncbi:hypothetical protein [Spiroplasma endosymbiont of Amphimallon solstitiale]|uniref:hypothetical protein n=1 Tax=Spiroplasma endosymbiont of Amphimallon solstitiale TaxID=3066288 RepID=UPI00313EA52F
MYHYFSTKLKEYFHEKISQSNELLLNTKKEPVFSKKIINSIDNKIEKTKPINITKGQKIKP